MNHITSLLIVLLLLTCSRAHADNWGHWRGNGNGVSTTATPPTTWSATQNVKWKVPIPGRGSGSPIVWADKVFVVTAVDAGGEKAPELSQQPERPAPDRQRGRRRGGRGRRGSVDLKPLEFKLMCFDRGSGKLLWEKTTITAKPHEGTHQTNGFASASPTTDGKHVYAHFGSRGLYCYTMDGEFVWNRNLGKMTCRDGFGEGSSPTLAGDLIIVPWDHEGPSYIAALNKTTGDTVWKTPRDVPSCWATPLVIEHKSGEQVVMNGQTCARGYDLKTGKELWRCAGQTQRPVASAVTLNGMVFIGSGFRGSFLGAFDLAGRSDLEGTENVVWSVDRDTPDIASPLLSGDRLYYSRAKSGILTCVDAKTGDVHYANQRLRGLDTLYASPIAAGGHVYVTGRSGNTIVIKDSDDFRVVAENSVGEGVDATPAPVDDQLFIRGEFHLFCIGG